MLSLGPWRIYFYFLNHTKTHKNQRLFKQFEGRVIPSDLIVWNFSLWQNPCILLTYFVSVEIYCLITNVGSCCQSFVSNVDCSEMGICHTFQSIGGTTLQQSHRLDRSRAFASEVLVLYARILLYYTNSDLMLYFILFNCSIKCANN